MGTRLGCFCDRLIEAGWLLTVTVVPVFFNLHTFRVFDPDKGYLLCGLAFVMTAAWLIKTTEHVIYRLSNRPGWSEWKETDHPRRSRLFYVLVVLSMLFAAVHIASTFFSIHPRTSLIGSFQRGQGTILTLCLIAISMLIATHLRTRGQLYRLLAAMASGSSLVALYTIVQYYEFKFGPARVGAILGSTMGSPGYVAAYLVMVIPLVLVGIILLVLTSWKRLQPAGETTSGRPPTSKTISYSFLLFCATIFLCLHMAALASSAHVAPLALLVITITSVLLLAAILVRRTRVYRILLSLTGVLILCLLLAFAVASLTAVPLADKFALRPRSLSSAPEVRQLILEGAGELFYSRPAAGGQPDRWQHLRSLLGYGPETIYYTYNQVYQPELGHYESRTAVPDHAHNQLLDVGVNLGWAGLVIFLLLLATFFIAAITKVWETQKAVETIVASGVLVAGLTHFIQTQFSLAIISTRLLFWVGLGIVAALVSRRGAALAEEESSTRSIAGSLILGAALLLLPATALSAVTLAGFADLKWGSAGILTFVASGTVLVLLVIILSAIAAALVRQQKPDEKINGLQWLLPMTGGLFAMPMFLLLVVAILASIRFGYYDSTSPTQVTILQIMKASTFLTWSAVFLGLLGIAFSLPRFRSFSMVQDRRGLVASLVAPLLYILIVAGTVVLILNICIYPVQADIAYYQASSHDHSGRWENAVKHYKHAIKLAPHADPYYLYLGRALLEQAKEEKNILYRKNLLTQAQKALERAQALNSLLPIHTANLARFHRHAAGLETDPAVEKAHAYEADNYYADATVLAPYDVILWNGWAILRHYELDDKEGFEQCIDRSLELDSEYEQTWKILGDVRFEQGNLEEAAEAYRKMLDIQPRQREVWSTLGQVYLQMGQYQDAIEAFTQTLELSSHSIAAWDVHRLLAETYYQQSNLDQALEEAQIALEMVPPEQRSEVEQLIQWLQQSSLSEETTP